jgi:hypothetical protein
MNQRQKGGYDSFGLAVILSRYTKLKKKVWCSNLSPHPQARIIYKRRYDSYEKNWIDSYAVDYDM